MHEEKTEKIEVKFNEAEVDSLIKVGLRLMVDELYPNQMIVIDVEEAAGLLDLMPDIKKVELSEDEIATLLSIAVSKSIDKALSEHETGKQMNLELDDENIGC